MAKKIICPLLRKPCIEDECAWWTTIRGYDVNTGKDVDNKTCVISTVPMLLIENSSQQRSTASAVESMRNEMMSKSDITNTLLTNVVVGARVQQLPSTDISFAELPPSTTND
jgi:hypothetical protein